jgi:hypothetical protein
MGAGSRATVASLSLCETSTVQGHRELLFVFAFKDVYECEILISEIERRPVLYGCSLKEYSEKGLKERLWKKCARAKTGMRDIMRKAKRMVLQTQYAQCFTATTSLPQTYDYNNTKTHQRCQIFQIKEQDIPQLSWMYYPINHMTI